MKSFSKMHGRIKLFLGFGIGIAFSLGIAIIGIVTAMTIEGKYSYTLNYP